MITPILHVALDELREQPYQVQALWAARIINTLRGCPEGLEPGACRPEDWSEDDEIWEAKLARTPQLQQVMDREGLWPPDDGEEGDDEEGMSLDEFLDRAEALHKHSEATAEDDLPRDDRAADAPAAAEPAAAAR